jgi:hypothetical protein
VDESGQHQEDLLMFVAGYVGNEAQWKQVEKEWPIAIAPRHHLHMRRLRFERDSEREMLIRVAQVPKRCGLQPILGGVRQCDYLPLLAGTQEERLLNGYVPCCFAMVINTLRNIPKDERLEVVFERQDRYGYLAYFAMTAVSKVTCFPEILMADGRSKLANWRFAEKEAEPLTEVADSFAYALFQAWKDRASLRAQWCQPILDAGGGEAYGAILDGSTMQVIGKRGKLPS